MEEYFPVVVLLSSPLSYTNADDRLKIVHGILVAASYINTTIKLIENVTRCELKDLTFNYNNMFYKPIRCGLKDNISSDTHINICSNAFINVERIMYIYQQISKINGSEDSISFPKGLMRLPKNINPDYVKPITEQTKQHFDSLIRPNTPIRV